MPRSSLGFHTMDLFLRLTRKEAEQLTKHFYRYCTQTECTRMLMPEVLPGGEVRWREYTPKYSGTSLLLPTRINVYSDRYENQGIKWTIRYDRQSENYKEYVIKAIINPKILGGTHDYINAATEDDIEVAAINFNRISRSISPVLRTFEHYQIKRIDYCINFSLNELAPGCTSDQIIKLIRRGDVPPHFREWAEFDSTSHRMKSKPDSFYLICKSTNINCYGKQVELRERNQKNPGSIPQATLASAQDIIRFEVQCKYPKVYALSRRAERDGNDSINNYHDLLKYQTCLKAINYHYKKTIGEGDWFTLSKAEKIIAQQCFNRQKRDRLLGALQEVSQCRSLARAKALHQGEDLAAFKRTLKDLSDIGINPVTIPREWGISHIPNLMHTYNDESLAKVAFPEMQLI